MHVHCSHMHNYYMYVCRYIYILEMGNQPILPINRDILFDNNQYRPIFTANSYRIKQ